MVTLQSVNEIRLYVGRTSIYQRFLKNILTRSKEHLDITGEVSRNFQGIWKISLGDLAPSLLPFVIFPLEQ